MDVVKETFLLAEKKGLIVHKNVLFPGWTIITRSGVRMVSEDFIKVKRLVENYNSPH
jgi:hypothetical protein